MNEDDGMIVGAKISNEERAVSFGIRPYFGMHAPLICGRDHVPLPSSQNL